MIHVDELFGLSGSALEAAYKKRDPGLEKKSYPLGVRT